MSAQELHDLFIKFSNLGDIHDFSQVWNEVKSLFNDDPKQNVNQYEIPEILKNLPLDETQIEAKLVNELMELDSTESSDMTDELSNMFRRLEIVQIEHTNPQVKFSELTPTTFTYTVSGFSDVDEKCELDDDNQVDYVELIAEQVSQEEKVIFDDTAMIKEGAPIVEEIAPIVEEIAPIVEEIAPIVEEIAPIVEEIAPIVEEIAPIVEEIAPIVEEVAPIVEEVAPIVEEVAPIVEEVVPIVEEVAPIVEEVAPVVEEVAPVVLTDKPIFPIFVLPAAENVVAQEKARLPYKVFNVHPERGPFQPDTVYLLRGIDPREAPQMNHKHGKMAASMEITHEDQISIEPAITSTVVPVIQPRPVFAISAEQFAKQAKFIQEKSKTEPVEELSESAKQQIEVETFVSEIVEDKPKVDVVEVPKLTSTEAITSPQRPVFAISAEQFAKQAKLIKEKSKTEPVEELSESAKQQIDVETFVSEIVEDKPKVDAVEVPKVTSLETITSSQRPVFAISAEQFAKQAKLIKEKSKTEPVEELSESTKQQSEVETFVSEIVEDKSNKSEPLTVEQKLAVDAFVSEIVIDQSNDVTPITPPPLPPPLPLLTATAQKQWAPVETSTNETATKQAPKATKPIFAISANQFATGAKQLKHVDVEKHREEKSKVPTGGDGIKDLLFKAMENVSTRTEGGKYAVKQVDDENVDYDNDWDKEEREEALIDANTALIRETISHKLNSVSFQEKLSIDLQELIHSKSDDIKKAVELYHSRLSADVKIGPEKYSIIESKISTMLEKVDLLIKQQLTHHGEKSAKSYYAENMADILAHKINLKESVEASVFEKLLAQFDQDLQMKMFDKIKIEMGTILSEESKYLSKADGLNASESYSRFAVDQLSKNLMADKEVVKDNLHDGEQSVESKPVDTQPIQSSLAAALQLRRGVMSNEQEEEEEESDWEDEEPTSQSLSISQEIVVVQEFAKSKIEHKSEDVANGSKTLETKKSLTVLSTQEIAEVESFVKDITKKGSPLSMADMIQSQDGIPGLQEVGVSNTQGKQDIFSVQPATVCNAVMMQQELVPQVATAHFE